MIYKCDNYKKRSVTIKNINLNLSENGIYRIKGKNGTGKTTLIESILFEEPEENFLWEQENERTAFADSKYNLFSYVPQKILYSELPVDRYIAKMNGCIQEAEVKKYLAFFDIGKDVLKKKFHVLSGGEQMKIAIISAVLKDTPYVFLDEPSNYLDDSSVEKLLELIAMLAEKKKIVIITHDPRMVFENCYKYEIKDQEWVVQRGAEKKPEKRSEVPAIIKPGQVKLFWNMKKRFISYITFYIILIFFGGIMTYTHLLYQDSIDESVKNCHDSIFVYYTEGHEELNAIYENAEKLTVGKDMYNHYISLDNLEELADNPKVKKMYMMDRIYTDAFFNELEKKPEERKLLLYSCPNIYTSQYETGTYANMELDYTEGRLPQDGADEVAISRKLLKQIYAYTDETVDKAIGDTIEINHKGYKIVGYSSLDIAIISFDSSEQYGYYCYDKSTYKQFYDRQMKYIKKRGMGDEVEALVLIIDERDDRELLNSLFCNYPSDCYISAYYHKVFLRQQKKETFNRYLGIHIGLSVIFAIIILLVSRRTVKYNMNIIYDIGNYYINRKAVVRADMIVTIGKYVLFCTMAGVVNFVLSRFAYLTWKYIMIDSMIIILPIVIMLVKYMKKANG